MGRLEKIVVLTVLFLITVILGVSLNQEDGGPASPVDMAGLPSAEAGAVRPAAVRDEARTSSNEPAVRDSLARADGPQPRALGVGESARRTAPAEREEAGLLSATVERPGAPREASAPTERVERETPSAEQERIRNTLLVTADGLVASPSPDYFFYEWRDGDTWTRLAERLYGHRRHTSLLLAANEGKSSDYLKAGERVWIPAQVQEDPARPGEVTQTAGGREYVVVNGDSLTTISDKVYGTMHRWKQIFEANRDLLSDPDRLKVGMKLRIPE